MIISHINAIIIGSNRIVGNFMRIRSMDPRLQVWIGCNITGTPNRNPATRLPISTVGGCPIQKPENLERKLEESVGNPGQEHY